MNKVPCRSRASGPARRWCATTPRRRGGAGDFQHLAGGQSWRGEWRGRFAIRRIITPQAIRRPDPEPAFGIAEQGQRRAHGFQTIFPGEIDKCASIETRNSAHRYQPKHIVGRENDAACVVRRQPVKHAELRPPSFLERRNGPLQRYEFLRVSRRQVALDVERSAVLKPGCGPRPFWQRS